MKFLDFHCDTVLECYRTKQQVYHNRRHVALDRADASYIQVFAIFVDDVVRGTMAQKLVKEAYAFFKQELFSNREIIMQCASPHDIETAEQSGKMGAVLSIENGAALGGELSMLNRLWEMGVRIMTMTWNGENELGGGALCGGGLTPFGKQVVHKMEALGMVVDVSHLSDEGFWQVADIAAKPFIATHSNCRKVTDHPRNLTDRQIIHIRDMGGIIGLNLHAPFLSDKGAADFDDIYRHIMHFMELGCENTLSFGCDMDGGIMPKGISGIESIPALCDDLLAKRIEEPVLRKIFYENGRSFLMHALTNR